jgi:DNA polymerase (family 10)
MVMSLSNNEIAKYFEKLAEYVELADENPFRVRAYQNAARIISTYPRSIAEMVLSGEDLTKLPHIGEKIAKKIEEIVNTGHLTALEHYEKMFPKGLLEMLAIPGLGPKRVREIYEMLGIDTLQALRQAAEAHRIQKLPGFNEKLEKRILEGIMMRKQEGKRFLYVDAEPYAQDFIAYMMQSPAVKKAIIAGSYRRRKETVGDLDMVVVTKSPQDAAEHFVAYEKCKEVIVQGESRTTVVLENDLQVDLKTTRPSDYGTTLDYFTGSRAHTLALRKMAKERGWKVNEYGIFDENGVDISGRTEKSFYKAFGLDYIEPELREMRGELEAARNHTLPKLIRQKNIKGDLHMHTHYSDGSNSVAEMADAARAKGYAYIVISDHSHHIPLLHGMTPEKCQQQWAEIDAYNAAHPGFTILRGMEVDILEDGTLAMGDETLRELDVVIVSVHDHFNLGKKAQTKRIIKAISNPYVHILGHPTGRLIGKRAPYDVDMEKIFDAALDFGTVMEINAQPTRLDLDDIYTKTAKEKGLKFSIDSDAHRTYCLDFMKYGVYQARRGWLEKTDVINTYSLKKLKKFLKH